MPAARRSGGSENAKTGRARAERIAGGAETTRALRGVRRAYVFGTAMNRKGLPMVWGAGLKERDDPAWKADREYLKEDGFFDKNGKVVR